MKKCNTCNLTFNTNRYTCPFCKNILKKDNDDFSLQTIYQEYPSFSDKIKKKSLTNKIFAFLSFSALLIVFITNIYEYYKGINSLWSLIALGGIFVLWALIKGLIISRKNTVKRIFTFCSSIIFLFLTIEYCSITNKNNYTNWSLTYIIPFILIATLSTINLLIISRRKSYSSYIGYQFWISLLLIAYHLLYILNITKVLWISLSCAMCGLLTIIGIFFFGGKKAKEEFKKRFII